MWTLSYCDFSIVLLVLDLNFPALLETPPCSRDAIIKVFGMLRASRPIPNCPHVPLEEKNAPPQISKATEVMVLFYCGEDTLNE